MIYGVLSRSQMACHHEINPRLDSSCFPIPRGPPNPIGASRMRAKALTIRGSKGSPAHKAKIKIQKMHDRIKKSLIWLLL